MKWDFKPNFEALEKYYKGLDSERTEINKPFFQKHFKDLDLIIQNHDLTLHRDDIFVMFLEICQNNDAYLFQAGANSDQLFNQARMQSIELQSFLNKIITIQNNAKHGSWWSSNRPMLSKIKLVTDKQLEITIDSGWLCYEIANILDKYYGSRNLSNEKKQTNKRRYKNNFIEKLRPFIYYLKRETNVFKSNNEIYYFVCSITDLFNSIDLDVPTLKDYFKGRNRLTI